MKKWMKKNTGVYLLMCMLAGALVGLILWAVVSLFALKSVIWLITFMGYGMFLGFLGGFLKAE